MIWGCKLPDLGLRITSICVPMWTSLAAHWLIICASTAGVQVLSLVGELRSCMLCGAANKKKKVCVNVPFIPRTEEPDAPQAMGSQRVGHS